MLGADALGVQALGGFDQSQSQAAVAAESARKFKKSMYPGGWVPTNLHVPPRQKIKQSTLKALKELYDEARDEIPGQLQIGLISPDILIRSRAVSTLPPPGMVDFEKLARNIETIRVLVAALDQARKRADEEANAVRRRKEAAWLVQFLAGLD